MPTTLWALRGEGLALPTALLRAEGISIGKVPCVSFILAQLEGGQTSTPAPIMLAFCSPKYTWFRYRCFSRHPPHTTDKRAAADLGYP